MQSEVSPLVLFLQKALETQTQINLLSSFLHYKQILVYSLRGNRAHVDCRSPFVLPRFFVDHEGHQPWLPKCHKSSLKLEMLRETMEWRRRNANGLHRAGAVSARDTLWALTVENGQSRWFILHQHFWKSDLNGVRTSQSSSSLDRVTVTTRDASWTPGTHYAFESGSLSGSSRNTFRLLWTSEIQACRQRFSNTSSKHERWRCCVNCVVLIQVGLSCRFSG